MYDHTIDNRPEISDNKDFTFFKIGISGEDKENLLSLKTMIKNNNDLFSRKILKIDCEGPEWEAFDKMDLKTLRSFEQIIGEFHWYINLNSEDYILRIRVMKKLNEHFIIFHMHGNNNAQFEISEELK